MRKIICVALLLSLIFSAFSCVEYNPPVNKNDSENSKDNNSDNSSVGGDGATDSFSEDAFTVTLKYNGKKYVPNMDITVYWRDGQSVHSSGFNSDGVAGVEGLDGDYRVSLSAVPAGLAYDPNTSFATNDNRNIEINLYKTTKTKGKGVSFWSPISMSQTGVYSTTLESDAHTVYFSFYPKEAGSYSIESWFDITDEEYNPIVKAYPSPYVQTAPTVIDGGGLEGKYTKNFVHIAEVSEDMIGNSFVFAVNVTSKNAIYPVDLVFAVKLNGEFDSMLRNYEMAVPEYDLSKYYDHASHQYGPAYELVGAEFLREGENPSDRNAVYMLDESHYKLWSFEDGGDGFYHLYDEEKYASNSGYGPILYMYLSTACRYLDDAFINVEYRGNSALTVNGKNYKHLIEGYRALVKKGSTVNDLFGLGSYYCVAECTCNMGMGDWVCAIGCESCHEDCRNCPEELIGNECYRGLVNSDGMVAVTQDIKDFLVGYAKNQRLFNDGSGWVESNSEINIDSKDGSEWLFACAYYKEK
ncbi:MAG: hypothetical protein IJY23_02205 [Clostridia bacterium]|nr:hypothetical protein [Clostridia bacterium]